MKRWEIGVYIYCFLVSPFMSDKGILFLLFFLPFFFWTVHFFTILTDKRYAVSFFCCLTQLIALIGYGVWITTCLILKGDFSYETVQNILKTNLVICIGVLLSPWCRQYCIGESKTRSPWVCHCFKRSAI